MTWTYNPAQLSTSSLFQVRYLMGDTISTDPQVQDEEINWALTQRATTYGAAAIVCRALAGRLSREVDTVDRELRDSISQRARAYSVMANSYEIQAATRGGGLPYAGGISIIDKENQQNDTDRVPPQFQIGMDDNLIDPIGPAGNEDEEFGNSG